MAARTVTDFGSAAVKVCSCAKPTRQNRNSTKVAATNFIFRILPADGLRHFLTILAAFCCGEGNPWSCIITSLISTRAERPGGCLQAEIGIIGGSGLYSMPGLTKVKEVRLKTPFGRPSDAYVCGTLEGRKVAFLARHGRGHRILPSELNFRANIHGFKQLGVDRIVSVSAVGSLKEEPKPLEFVIPDQFFHRTRHRVDTFFGGGVVAHIAFADPVCAEMASVVEGACKKSRVAGKRGGTYLCMEGPQFSTKAESNVYRSWGMDVIGMTNLQEAKLAREAELCYVTIAMVTDFDCWHEEHDAVTVTDILANLKQNADNACKVVAATVASMPDVRECKCGSALAHALMTDLKAVPTDTRRK